MSDSMIQESSARLFAENVDKALLERFEAGEWPGKLWSLVADNGLTMALASEASGGIGATWQEAYPILHGAGYWRVPIPLAETMVAALMLSKAELHVPEGPMALIDELQTQTFAHSQSATGATELSGVAKRVPWARYCRWALVHATNLVGAQLSSTKGEVGATLALIDLADAKTVKITQRLNPALEPEDEVALTNAPCLALLHNPWPELTQPLRLFGALTRSAMMVGAMEWLLEQSVQYAKDRVQFGKPIGRNQAIQQSLAQLAGDVSAARMATYVAFGDAPNVGSARATSALFSAAVAKVRSGEAATRATSVAHQTHGAIGFTYEHALNFATRRLWAWREAYGSDAWWAQKLGEAAISAGAVGFWPSLTSKHLEHLK